MWLSESLDSAWKTNVMMTGHNVWHSNKPITFYVPCINLMNIYYLVYGPWWIQLYPCRHQQLYKLCATWVYMASQKFNFQIVVWHHRCPLCPRSPWCCRHLLCPWCCRCPWYLWADEDQFFTLNLIANLSHWCFAPFLLSHLEEEWSIQFKVNKIKLSFFAIKSSIRKQSSRY